MTRLIALLPIAILAACEAGGPIQTGGGNFEEALDSHLGLTEQQLVRKFGTPISSVMNGDRKSMTWAATNEVYFASVAPSNPQLSGGEPEVLPIAGDTVLAPLEKVCDFTYELEERDVVPERPQTEIGGVQFVAVASSYDQARCG